MHIPHCNPHLRIRETIIDLLALLLLATVVFSLNACGPVAELAGEGFGVISRSTDDKSRPQFAHSHAMLATVVINRARWEGRDLVIEGTSRNPATVDVFDGDTGEELATTRSRMTRVHGNYWTVTIQNPEVAPRHIRVVANHERAFARVAGEHSTRYCRRPDHQKSA